MPLCWFCHDAAHFRAVVFVCSGAHVLLNLLIELGEKIRCDALPSILSISSNELNKFNNTEARMQDSLYHMALKSHLINSHFRIKTSGFRQKKTRRFIDVNA